jgi:hypothetical protein
MDIYHLFGATQLLIINLRYADDASDLACPVMHGTGSSIHGIAVKLPKPVGKARCPPQGQPVHVSFCLMKKDRRCESCQAQVTPSTSSWSMVHRTTRELVDSD